MAKKVTLGGDRLQSGKKMKVEMNGFERSTHNLNKVIRTTMACGTLVPFYNNLGLPGDTFDIDTECYVLTQPTIGPLFGTYKVQIDWFWAPLRLYSADLNLNLQGQGLKMEQVKLPQMELTAAAYPKWNVPMDNQQINPSSIFKYYGISGLGFSKTLSGDPYMFRKFNGVPDLMYWDTYKQYYANKQEGIGVVIHKNVTSTLPTVSAAWLTNGNGDVPLNSGVGPVDEFTLNENGSLNLNFSGNSLTSSFRASQVILYHKSFNPLITEPVKATMEEVFQNFNVYNEQQKVTATAPTPAYLNKWVQWLGYDVIPAYDVDGTTPPELVTFPLENIDQMRKDVLTSYGTEFVMNESSIAPYGLKYKFNVVEPGDEQNTVFAKTFSQEGLGVKTYNSDVNNNWMNTSWIEGPDSVTDLTRVVITDDSFTIDEFNIKQKLWKVLQRIALSDGSIDAWQEANWDHERPKIGISPVYLGGLIRQLVFDEVISNAASAEQPLGTLAGRGMLNGTRKGGKVVVRCDEPGWIMGIASITPNLDYSQGNSWFMNLKNMDELHKPGMDQIGFQNLLVDQFAWWSTRLDPGFDPEYQSAGKQPAWTNYTTDVNETKGAFAEQTQQMFMTLNRQYSVQRTAEGMATVRDITTYIDPSKFNNIFADTRLDAQNFWVQIGLDITARRKMSARVMPNL